MKKNQHNKIYQKSLGFSLIETLLSVFILVGLLLTLTIIGKSHAERLLHKAMAQYVDQVRGSVSSLLQVPGNYTAIYNEADLTVDGFLQTNIDDLRDGVFLAGIASVDNMEDSFVDNTLFQNGLDIIIRIADDRAIGTDVQQLEIFVASNDQINFMRGHGIASELKEYGGLLDNGIGVNSNITSVYSSWAAPLVNLINTNWHTVVTTALAPPSPVNGVYVVAYENMNFQDITGDYLYREDVGDPELNRMYTALNMGNNNLLGVDDLGGSIIAAGGQDYQAKAIIVDSRVVLSDAALNVTGDSKLSEGNMYVDGTASIGNNLTIEGTGTDADTTGRFITQGTMEVTDTITTSQIDATTGAFQQGVTTTNNIDGENFTATGGVVTGLSNFSTANVTGSIDAINVTNSLTSTNLSTGGFSVEGDGSFGAINMNSSGTLTANELISTGTLTVNELNVGTFGSCDNGC